MDYTPTPVPLDQKELSRYLQEELQRMSYILRDITARNVEFLTVAPARPREGMLYGADGVNWNPGGGKGVYCYYGGAWTKL
jgi:hypothetical protein